MIYGIDPASKKLAIFGIGPDHARSAHVAVKKSDRGTELRALRQWLDLQLVEDDVVFIEEPVLAGRMNIRSTILIAETVGVVMSVARTSYLVPVSSWKKETVGSGAASKENVQSWLDSAFPSYSALCAAVSDLYDAAAIAVYGQQVCSRSLG